MGFFEWADNTTTTTEKDILLKRLHIETTWYRTYYEWTGPKTIRDFELKRSKLNIKRLCAVYWILNRNRRNP